MASRDQEAEIDKRPVEAFEPPWRDVSQTPLATHRRRRLRRMLVAVALVLGVAFWWVPCWRGRMAACDFWCSAGSAQSCNVLARNYDDGDGTDLRDDLAVVFYQKACDANYATACVNLGIMYESAEGVAPDPVVAARLFARGCPEKLSGCRRLAALMADHLVPADPSVAQPLERACDGHDDEAMKSCNALARLYDMGIGVPLDDRQAVKLYARACDGHLDVACFNLSLMVGRGEGVAADEKRAAELFERGCANSTAARCRRQPNDD